MADDDQPKEKEEALDLLAGNKKPSRRERQRLEAAKNKTIDDKKAEALDLGVENEEAAKPNLIRKTEKSGKDVLPSISKKLEEHHDPEFVKTEAPAADEGGDEDDGATVDGNVISAPIVQEPIDGGQLHISTGAGDPEQQRLDAQRLAAALNAGATR